MPNSTVLDVLIVYNGATAASASDDSANVPFLKSSQNVPCNDAYAYMLSYCESLGIKAGFTTSKDIVGPGRASNYWIVKDKQWTKIIRPAFSKQIFDKFSPKNLKDAKTRAKLFSSFDISPYNSKEIFEMFFDKQNTYDSHPSCTIPTLSLTTPTLTHIKTQCQKLSILTKLSSSSDYTTHLIMKDRFGAGGWHVYKIAPNGYAKILSIMQKNPKISFIIQPFTLFDAKDIRLIYIDGKLLQSYFRTAARGNFRCNEHQGGTSTYINLNAISKKILAKADFIVSSLNHVNTLFALDFIVGNSGDIHFIEGNTGPGLSWNKNIQIEVKMGKQLIRSLVKNIYNTLSNTKMLKKNQYISNRPIISSSIPVSLIT